MDCGFSDNLNNWLKNHFVIGLRSDHIKTNLLKDEDQDIVDNLKKAKTLD